MNHLKIIFQLFKALDIHFTYSFVKSFFNLQQQPPSAQAISNLLDLYEIDSMVVEFTSAQLKEVDYPILALIESKKEKQYVILNRLKDKQITYTSGNGKSVTEALEAFEKKWSGMAILIDPQNKKPEPGYEHNKKSEKKAKLRTFLFYAAGLFLAGSIAYMLIDSLATIIIPFLFLKIVGIYISIHLIKESAGVHTEFSTLVCKTNDAISCQKILSSNASKIAGVSLSDLGFLYFAITSIFILFSYIDSSILAMVQSASLVVLPFTFFSVYYQWRVVKSWCPMCLIVLVIFWLEFLVMSQLAYAFPQFSLENVVSSLSVITSITILFSLFKREWLKGLGAISFEKRYHSFRESEDVMSSILESGKEVSELSISSIFELSYPKGENELIVITGPTCGPCSAMHGELEQFLGYFDGYLSVKIIPTLSKSDTYPSTVSKHMIDFLSSDAKEKHAMINSWFNLEIKDESSFEEWRSLYSIKEGAEKAYDEIINWLQRNQINHTPCFVLNGRIVNNEYRLPDIKKYLKRKLN